MPSRAVWTADRIRELGVVTSLSTAASVLGIGRTLAYQLVAAGQFPVPFIRAGNRVLVPVRPLLHLLHLDTDRSTAPAVAAAGLDDGAGSSVDTPTHPADSPTSPRAADPEHHGDDA
jgi:hypothetical protein